MCVCGGRAARRWLNPAVGQPGRVPWFGLRWQRDGGSWEHSLARRTAVHQWGRGPPHAPVTDSHGCGGTSRCGTRRAGWDGPARRSAMPCHAASSRAARSCLHRPVLAELCPAAEAAVAAGLQLTGCSRGPGVDPSAAGGLGQGAHAQHSAAGCVCPVLAPGGCSCIGMAVGGREELGAAPLEVLDVPPAGLSGRSRSCPNRSPGSQHRLLQLPGLGWQCGAQGPPLPLHCLHWAVPTLGSITLKLGHRTPRGMVPWGVSIILCCCRRAWAGARALRMGEMLPHAAVTGTWGVTGSGERSRVLPRSTAGTAAPHALTLACTEEGLMGALGLSWEWEGGRERSGCP